MANAHYNLGVALAELGQRNDARACYRHAAALEPSTMVTLRRQASRWHTWPAPAQNAHLCRSLSGLASHFTSLFFFPVCFSFFFFFLRVSFFFPPLAPPPPRPFPGGGSHQKKKVGFGARCNLCNLVAASDGLGASAKCLRALLADAPDYERALVNLAGTLQTLAEAGPVRTSPARSQLASPFGRASIASCDAFFCFGRH
jgi:tetratricopeptide (TPR) repeat protein